MSPYSVYMVTMMILLNIPHYQIITHSFITCGQLHPIISFRWWIYVGVKVKQLLGPSMVISFGDGCICNACSNIHHEYVISRYLKLCQHLLSHYQVSCAHMELCHFSFVCLFRLCALFWLCIVDSHQALFSLGVIPICGSICE